MTESRTLGKTCFVEVKKGFILTVFFCISTGLSSPVMARINQRLLCLQPFQYFLGSESTYDQIRLLLWPIEGGFSCFSVGMEPLHMEMCA